ncbi:MAG: S8 family serine peptidase [Anaerolineae bacterium]|nr:S8 family serine peptidase [Anaerolineae bacterium]
MKKQIKQFKLASLAAVATVTMLASQTPALSYETVSLTKMPPALSQMAAKATGKNIPILVMKTDSSDTVEKYAESLGVEIRLRIEMLNAFAAEVDAATLYKLAKHNGVKWVSPDGEMESSAMMPAARGEGTSLAEQAQYNTIGSPLRAVRAINAPAVWQAGYTGRGVGVAVIDSGITPFSDLSIPTNRLVAAVDLDGDSVNSTDDDYGHGTHVASVIASNGLATSYMGVAPEANIINVKVADGRGKAKVSSVVAGMEWVLRNKAAYNIRVANLSLNTTWVESYHTSPLNAAAEILWFNNIVVVTSAGNRGPNTVYAPANDPFVITVGGIANAGTDTLMDDAIASFSSYGRTESGFAKPDVVAHAYGIYGVGAKTPVKSSYLYATYPNFRSGANGFMMTGTSAAAPLAAGTVALMLQAHPTITPDQVKYRLSVTAYGIDYCPACTAAVAGAGQIDADWAISFNTSNSANTNIPISKLIVNSGLNNVVGSSVSWNSVSWNSVSWNSVSWNSVSWNSTAWSSGLQTSVFFQRSTTGGSGKADGDLLDENFDIDVKKEAPTASK